MSNGTDDFTLADPHAYDKELERQNHGIVTESVGRERTHDLKIQPCYFARVLSGAKKAEMRLNDRDFHEGDTLLLREYATSVSGIPGMYTGRELTVRVTDALYGPCYGIADGYVMLSIEPAAMQHPSTTEEGTE